MSTPPPQAERSGRARYLVAVVCGVFVGMGGTALMASDRPPPRPLPLSVGGSQEGPEAPAPSVERTPEGAVRAADAWVRSGRSLMATDPLTAEQAVRAMTTGADGDRLVTDTLTTLRQLRQKLAGGTGPVILHQAVLATRTTAAAPDRARVELWNVSVLAREGIAPPQASWATSTIDLAWERDGWRVSAVRVTPGPAPILSDASVPATATELADALDGFGDGGGGS